MVSTTNQPPSYARVDECANLPVETSFMREARLCVREDELPFYYHIIQNVPLTQVKHFVFGEHHGNATHYYYKSKFVSDLGKPRDFVLFEGMESTLRYLSCDNEYAGIDKKFECQGWEDALMWEKRNLVGNNTEFTQWNSKLTTTLKDESTKESCLSAISKLYDEFVLYYFVLFPEEFAGRNLHPTKKYLHLACEKQSQLNQLEGEMQAFRSANLFNRMIYGFQIILQIMSGAEIYPKKLFAQIDLVRGELADAKANAFSSFGLIKGRNKGLINKLESLKSHPGRFFTFVGSAHPVPHEILRKQDKVEIHQDDDQYELREYLAKKPHAILIPR